MTDTIKVTVEITKEDIAYHMKHNVLYRMGNQITDTLIDSFFEAGKVLSQEVTKRMVHDAAYDLVNKIVYSDLVHLPNLYPFRVGSRTYYSSDLEVASIMDEKIGHYLGLINEPLDRWPSLNFLGLSMGGLELRSDDSYSICEIFFIKSFTNNKIYGASLNNREELDEFLDKELPKLLGLKKIKNQWVFKS